MSTIELEMLKNLLIGFENYMYYQSSSYVSSSIGLFYDNVRPKTDGGTFTSPYVLNIQLLQ